MVRVKTVLFSLFVAGCVSAQTTETTLGNGGDMVVCFNIPLTQAITITPQGNIRVTEEGWAHMEEDYPMTLDYFEAKFFRHNDLNQAIPLFQPRSLNTGYKWSILQDIMDTTYFIPVFYDRWTHTTQTYFGNQNDWRKSPWGLKDLQDSNEAYPLPDNCASLQGARYYQGHFYINSVVVEEHSNPFQQALLLGHEGLYFIAKEMGHTDSVKARDLLGDILTAHALYPNDKEREIFLKNSLIKNGFGVYQTQSELEEIEAQKRAQLQELQQQITSMEDNLYNEDLEALLKLRAEFAKTPDDMQSVERDIERFFELRVQDAEKTMKTDYGRTKVVEVKNSHQKRLERYHRGSLSINGYCFITLAELSTLEIIKNSDEIHEKSRGFFERIFSIF
ncbi:MAG TPA: hypothetical protein VJB34_09160 [Bdellovibrionota bacterium]|nr:hypothetical protein [Bdellovibrionota bacterium]